MTTDRRRARAQTTALSAVCELRNGRALSRDAYADDGSVLVYGANGAIGRTREAGQTHEVAIIGRVGAYCGVVHRALPPSWVTDNAIAATARAGVNQRYLYYLLRYLPLADVRSGSAQPLLTQAALRSIPCPRHELAAQRQIAEILGALDDEIALSQAVNHTLERMAQAIYKSWFLDFDGDHERVLSEHGVAVPPGFRTQAIGDVVRLHGGNTPSTKVAAYWHEGTNYWATPKDLAPSVAASPVLLSTARTITDQGLARISSGLLPRGTVLLSSRAPIGHLAITAVPTAVNQGFIAMLPCDALPSVYLYHWAKNHMDAIRARAGGTTFQEISKRSFRPIPVVIPPIERVRAFDAAVTPLFEHMAANARECEALAALRDRLLPRLMTGELALPGTR